MIAFNRPYLTGKEISNIEEAMSKGVLSGNGDFSKYSQRLLEKRYDFKKVLLTTSCTDALEMASILIGIEEGDEVIIPSYTFVSTANAFVLRGAKIVYVDSNSDHPGLDADKLESLITKKTKAIVPVHYAGVACDMEKIMAIARKHKVFVVEDAAQAIDSKYKDQALGGIGDLGCYSFHETKNISSGEGGALIINNPDLLKRAEIIWEKGTNRAAFWRGEVDKYSWVDMGSSYLPSELNAAYLAAQLDSIDEIQKQRLHIWESYHRAFEPLEKKSLIRRPIIPSYASNNAHMYYLVLPSLENRTKLIDHLKKKGVHAVFHYIALHTSDFGSNYSSDSVLTNAEAYTNRLLRLPLYAGLSEKEHSQVIDSMLEFYL